MPVFYQVRLKFDYFSAVSDVSFLNLDYTLQDGLDD